MYRCTSCTVVGQTPLHHGGLWSDHLWVELQKYINGLGRQKIAQIDKNFQAFPRWRDQKHPANVMNVSFMDNSTHEDISKMIVYAAHDIVIEKDSPFGYLLLRCVHLYLEVDMYSALEVHTADTISAGRHTFNTFSALLEQYIRKVAPDSDDDSADSKNWNFPKLHLGMHIFDDIEAKGATRNYNTKPNEKMHGSLKDSYLLRTNFRDVAEQILRINHWQVVADRIRRRIVEFDEYQRQSNDYDSSEETEVADIADCLVSLGGILKVKLGSKQPTQTFDSIEKAHQGDRAFGNFRTKLNDFLNALFHGSNIPPPNRKPVQLRGINEVTEYRFLRVNYESMVDWRLHTDYLRCSPQFFGAPRFDCVFIQMTDEKVILGRLLFLFECPIGSHTFPGPLALVHTFDAATGVRLRKDKDLGLFRV